MLKKYILTSLLPCLCMGLMAIPALPIPTMKFTADGDSLLVTLCGDHWLHYYMSADGRWWRETSGDTIENIPTLTTIEAQQARHARRHITAQTTTAAPLNIAPKGLVILVNFSDVSFNAANTQSEISDMLNGDHYTYNDATGSARQYFIDQSRGQYQPHFDVVGPVTLSHNMAYYGEDDTSFGYDGEDIRAIDMIVEACKLADSQCGVDFTQYDCNNDGEVDFVFVIYAGYSQAEGAPSNTIWPHSFWVSDFHGETAGGITCIIDGKKINTYACGSELKGTNGNIRSGIGTFCHEFSHVLGLPDLYITSGSSTHRTMGSWDILDMGPYNNQGRTPPAYSAYERFFCGWLTPTILNTAGTYQLTELTETNAAVIITYNGQSNLKGNDPNPTEFFLLENRQQTGWDKYLAGHGMMITKIKFSYNTWYYNSVNNNRNNMGVDLIEASSNTHPYIDRATDLFPRGATSYTPYDTYPITNITETDSIISFDFMGGGDSIILTKDDYIAAEEQIIAIYNLQGYSIPVSSSLPKGIYIIVTDHSVRKISIK